MSETIYIVGPQFSYLETLAYGVASRNSPTKIEELSKAQVLKIRRLINSRRKIFRSAQEAAEWASRHIQDPRAAGMNFDRTGTLRRRWGRTISTVEVNATESGNWNVSRIKSVSISTLSGEIQVPTSCMNSRRIRGEQMP